MKKPILVLCTLVAIFVAPGIAAYLYYLHPNWISGRTNHGALSSSPWTLQTPALSEKWSFIYWHPAICQQDCIKNLESLAKVRLSLGRKLYQVNIFLASAKGGQQPASVVQLLKQMDIYPLALVAEDVNRLRNPDLQRLDRGIHGSYTDKSDAQKQIAMDPAVKPREVEALILRNKPAIYLVDKAHRVILTYTENQSPDDIYEDLKKMVADA